MPTFQRCPPEVAQMAKIIMEKFDSYEILRKSKVTLDYVFAFADVDPETGAALNDALSRNGVKVLGLCRKLPLKDRAMGRADAEISLDGDWWRDAADEERAALLDHELHHLVPTLKMDDLGRPLLKLRKHDFEVGWFHLVAARHGISSQERYQAQRLWDSYGQLYWPELNGVVKLATGKTANAA